MKKRELAQWLEAAVLRLDQQASKEAALEARIGVLERRLATLERPQGVTVTGIVPDLVFHRAPEQPQWVPTTGQPPVIGLPYLFADGVTTGPTAATKKEIERTAGGWDGPFGLGLRS